MKRIVGATLAVAVGAGCLGTPKEAPGAPADAAPDAPDAPGCTDADGDGWPAGCATVAADLRDCNDADRDIHPGARERVGLGVDNDCDLAPLEAISDFPDLVRQPLGLGMRLDTRLARVELDEQAGYQLHSLHVRQANTQLSGELLYDGSLEERDSGVHVWRDFFSTRPDDRDITTLTNGPAIYQARVTYADGGTAGDRAMVGDSLYTITLDGRVHRTDRFDLRGDPTSAEFHSVTSFVALDVTSAFDTIRWWDAAAGAVDSDPVPPSGPGFAHYSNGGNEPGWSCVTGAQVEVGWTKVVPTGQPVHGMRIRSNINPPMYRQVALQYDWELPAGLPTRGLHRGHFLILPGPPSTGCDAVATRARAFYQPVTVSADTPARLVTDDVDDEGSDGFVEGGGYWALTTTNRARLRFGLSRVGGTSLPPYATFRLSGVPDDVEPVVYVEGHRVVNGQQYRLQLDPDRDLVWLVMLIGLQDGQPVELVYPTACAACGS